MNCVNCGKKIRPLAGGATICRDCGRGIGGPHCAICAAERRGAEAKEKELLPEIQKMLIVISAFTEEGSEGHYLLEEWQEKYAVRKVDK